MVGFGDDVSLAIYSKYYKYIIVIAEDNGDPIAKPSCCQYMSKHNWKYAVSYRMPKFPSGSLLGLLYTPLERSSILICQKPLIGPHL